MRNFSAEQNRPWARGHTSHTGVELPLGGGEAKRAWVFPATKTVTPLSPLAWVRPTY